MSIQNRFGANQMQPADQETLSITLGQILMSDKGAQHAIDIQCLKQQLEEKDIEIADLQLKLTKIQEKNNDLQIKLNTKDKEVEELKEKIEILEEEKAKLQDELSQVKSKLKRLENDVKALNKSSKSQEKENQKLKEDLQKVEYTMKTTEEKLTSENEKLKKEVKQLRDTRTMPMIEQQRVPVQLPQSTALLHLGELCWQIQGKMYQKVFPEYYTPIRSYKVKNIEKDVKKLVKTIEEGDAAKERWERLKFKLNWNEELEETIKSLQDSRNIEAHPIINESLLHQYAAVLEKNGILKGWLSLDRVNKLIDIWKSLTCEDKIQ